MEILEFGEKNGEYLHGDLIILKVKAVVGEANASKITDLKFL